MLRRRRRAGASRTTSWPRIVTDPRSGVSSVAKIDSSVVLPAPFGPSTPTMAPRGTASETPRSASVCRRRIQPARNVFVTSRASIASMELNGNMRPMTAPGEWRCRAADLGPGSTAKLRVTCGGRALEGFIVNHGGAYHAYVNRCPHVGTPLDLWPNEFWAEDGRTFICSTHGALYEPPTGYCTAGPCAGDSLTPLPLRREAHLLVVTCP